MKPLAQILGCISIALLGSVAFADEIERTYEVAGKGRFVIDVESGDIDLRAGDDGLVSIRITRSGRHVKRMHVEFSQVSDREIRVIGDLRGMSLFGRGKTSAVVTVPPQFEVAATTRSGRIVVSELSGSVAVKSHGGDIEIGDMNGPTMAWTSGGDIRVAHVAHRLTVETSGGDIRIDATDGDLNARTTGGSIAVNEVTGRSVLRSSGGDVRLERAYDDVEISTGGGMLEVGEVSGQVHALSSGGSIKLGSVTGADLNASGGDIRVLEAKDSVVARTSGSIDVAIVDRPRNPTKLESSGGRVTLAIAPGVDARIRAATSGGKIQNGLPGFVLDAGSIGDADVSGHIGTGAGPLLELRSSGGDLYVLQHRAAPGS